MDLRGFTWGGNTTLPLVRNNYLYNYSDIGINVQGLSGNIGAINDPGMNTLYSNSNTAIDINSTNTIYVADNFGMFNISFPEVQITSNNPYHSTASCGHQIYNMPSQGNLNTNYVCDNFLEISDPLVLVGGAFKLLDNYTESLSSSSNQFNDANMILSCLEAADQNLLTELISITTLLENEKSLLRYEFYLRNSDFVNARNHLNLFVPENDNEEDYKTLSLYDLDISENGWEVISEIDKQVMILIKDKESVNSNMAITLLNNISSYLDHIVTDPIIKNVELSDNFKQIGDNQSYMNLWPNPSTGKVYIELITSNESDNSLEIFDVSGKLIEDYSVEIVSGIIELDIKNLSEGFYFITLIDASGFIQKGKLIKVSNYF